MNEDKEKKGEYISEYEKRLKGIIENNQYIPPEIALAYTSIQISKQTIEVAFNQGNKKANYLIPQKPKSQIAKEIRESLKALKVETENRGKVLSGIPYDSIEITAKRIMREHNVVIHPRTKELLCFSTEDYRLPKITKEHLNYCPRLPYHTVVNRRQISGIFIVCKNERDSTAKPYEVIKLFLKGLKLNGKLKFQKTANFKLDYNNGIKKPAKRPSKKGLWVEILKERDKAKMQLLNGWKLQQKHKRPKPKRKLISQITITNITTN